MHYSFKSTPTTSFKFRTETITKSNQPSSIPGPADYNVSKPLHKSGTVASTRQKRQLFKFLNQVPGPGSYQSKSYISTGPQRSISARLIRQPMKTPGPMDYQAQLIKTKVKAPKFSMGSKSKSAHKLIEQQNIYKPGPGYYNPQNTISKSSAFNFGNSKRKDLTQTQKTPAPNYYSPQKAKYSSVTNPRCKIGTQKRQLLIKNVQKTPGPDFYIKKSFIDENNMQKKGYSCRSKIKDLIAEQLAKHPGPGQYKSETLIFKKTAPRCLTSQSKRMSFIDQIQNDKKDIPFSSTSNVNNLFKSSKYRASSASLFGNSKRRPLDENQNTPGPLAYASDRLKILNKQPSFSCTKSQNKNQFLKNFESNNPGPGYYDSKINLIKEGKQNTIVLKANRPTFDKQKQKPGVGQYNIENKNNPKFAFTKQKRIAFTDKNNEAKNGTFYNIAQSVANPPSYMKIQSKIKFSPSKSCLRSTGF